MLTPFLQSAVGFAGFFLATATLFATEPEPPFHPSPWFNERVREWWVEPGIRVRTTAPDRNDPARPTRLVIFATPNGNTIEQTLGCGKAEGLDWHFDIQHVAAQIRRYRELTPNENVVLAVVEAEGLSWPAWRAKHKDHAAHIKAFVEMLRDQTGPNLRVALTGHSGGGSFLTGFLNAHDAIPAYVDHISYLDSNYSYSDAEKHGDKLIAWLKGDESRKLAVIAYDDREITLEGKKVVGPDGGTFRATCRMTARFEKDFLLPESKDGDVVTRTGLNGRVTFRVHTNPQNKILHTARRRNERPPRRPSGPHRSADRGRTRSGFNPPPASPRGPRMPWAVRLSSPKSKSCLGRNEKARLRPSYSAATCPISFARLCR